MSHEKNIDIETFRRSSGTKFRLWLKDAISFVFHHGWMETDARIDDCTPLKGRGFFYRIDGYSGSGGYAVGLSYEVAGRRYEAETISPVELQLHNTIRIRYNPAHPAQNNSFGSETSWASSVANISTTFAIILLFVLLAFGLFSRY